MNTEHNDELQLLEKKQWIDPEFKELELNGGSISADFEDAFYRS